MRLRQVWVSGGTNVVTANLATSNGVVSDASHLDRVELLKGVGRECEGDQWVGWRIDSVRLLPRSQIPTGVAWK